MKPRRILIFSLFYYPRFVGGAEVAVKEITDRIPASDAQFDMITQRKGQSAFERIGNVNVHRVSGSKLLYIPLAFWKVVRLSAREGYDVAWSIMASYAGFAALLYKFHRKNAEFVLTLQEGENYGRKMGIMKPFFGMIFRRADRIQAISNYLKDWAKSMGARTEAKIVPNAVDFEFFSKPPAEAESGALLGRLHKKNGEVFLITTSRLVRKNAIEDIIRSLVFLPPNIKLIVLGTGELESRLKACVEKLSLRDRVVFEGYVAHDRMKSYLKISDIFIRPSLSEGFGNSFIEAMAAGIPVIATPVGGIVDFLRDRETGLFCRLNDPQDIAAKVKELIENRELKDRIVMQAAGMVKEKYEWNNVAEEMKKLLLS